MLTREKKSRRTKCIGLLQISKFVFLECNKRRYLLKTGIITAKVQAGPNCGYVGLVVY